MVQVNPVVLAIEVLLAREELATEHREEVIRTVLEEEVAPEQLSSLLTAWRAKGYAVADLVDWARALRSRAVVPSRLFLDAVDTCGTGGGAPSFNISTAAAFVVAAAGIQVAKHGNRAVSSQMGSADILEAVGFPLGANPVEMVDRFGIGFFFAPQYHPVLAKVGPVRRAMGVRTIFNFLGPLLNPVGVRRQVIGVYDPGMIEVLAAAAVELGAESVAVVHGEPGLDEVSPVGATWVGFAGNTEPNQRRLELEELGLSPVDPTTILPGETKQDSVHKFVRALQPGEPENGAILPSAALAVFVSGRVADLREAAKVARETLLSGKAQKLLEEVKRAYS